MAENIDLRMAEAIKLSKIAFFSYLFDGTILEIDRVAFDFFELEGIFKDPQSVTGKNIESLFVYIGPKGRIRDEIRARGRIAKLEYGIRTLKNTEKWGIHNSYIYIDKKTGEEAIQVCFYDITDRKLHEVEIDNQYKILVENSIEVIWTMDLEGNFTYMSPSVEMLRGYTVEEAMKMTLEETLTPESFITSMTELQNWLSKPNDEFPQSFTMELEQFKKDGTTVWTLVTIKPIFDNDGEVFELQGGTRDISHKKKAEKDLTASEEKYRTIVEHVNDAFYAHDFKGKIIDVNVNSCNMLGYKKKELVGQSLSIFTGEEETLLIKKRMKKLIKEKKLIFEGEHITKKGTGIQVSISAKVVSTEGPGIIHSFVRDISEMKEIENALIISEEKYSALVEHSRDIIVIVQEGKITYVNKAAKQITGEEPDKIIGMDFLSWIAPEYHEKVAQYYRERMSGKKVPNIYEIALIKKDGFSVPIEVNASLITYQGKPADLIIVRDISERKKAQEDLNEKTEFLNAVVNNTHDGIFVIDEDFNYVFINPASGRIMGHDPEDWIGKRAGTNRHPDDEKKSIEAIIKALNGEPSTCELRVKHSSGEYHLLQMRYSLMMTGDDVHILGMVNDITEKKKIETALIENENRLNTIFEFAPDAYYLNDFEGVFVDGNKAAEKLLGYPREELIGKNFVDAGIIAMDEVEKAIRLLGENINGNPTGPDDYVLTRKDGTKVNVEVISHPVKIGGEDRVLGIARDITEKKKVEEALMASEERYRNIVELSPDGIMTISRTGKVLGVNKSFCELTGYDEKDFVGKSIAKIPTKPSIGDAIKIVRKVFSGVDLKTIDFKWTHKNGEIRDGEAKLKKVGKGEAGYLQAVVRDVTEEKKAEIALRASEEKYRTLFEHSPESIILVDLEGRIIECNDVTTKLTGYSKKELIGNSYVDLGILHKDDVEKYATLFFNVLKSGEVSIFEARMKHKDGHDYWVEGYPSFLYENGDVSAIQVISRDITERKITEKEMRRRFLKYELNEGNIYIVKERKHIRSADAFNELMQIGYPGLIISRKPLKHFKEKINQEYAHLWISEKEGEHNILPKENDIINMIDSISRGQVVFLDGINYLISKIGFKSCQSIIQTLSEIAHLKDHIIIIQIDPLSLTPYQLSQFESETLEIAPQMSEGKLPEKLIDVLKFVNDSNNEGAKPSYSDIGAELELSKPTVRDRVRKLESMGYLNEMSKGRSKYLEITEKGKTYMAFR